ncbi:MAG: aaeB, partial [Caulobacteraceae bacterium]|nr:aaeB [Caulobacteraceae bacterium]
APPAAEQAPRLQARCRALAPAIGADSDWKALLTVSILVRLEELIQALQDSRDLASLVDGPQPSATARTEGLLQEPRRRRLHLDHGMAALSGVSLMVAVLFCCAVWIATGWPEGAVAAMMAAVFSSFFAAQDDPAPAIGVFLIWTALSIPAAALYLFVVLPAIDGFAMLALALAPALLLIGYFQAVPRWGLPALAVLLGFAGALSLQSTFSADLPAFLNSNLAECVGIAAALAAARLLRSVGAGWAARRILRLGWRDIALLARRRAPVDPDSWSGAMLDRVGLVTARVALAGPEDNLDAHDVLADMRVGLNLIDLNALALRADRPLAQVVDRTLEGVAGVFEKRLAGAAGAADADLLRSIDRAIAGLTAAGDSDPRQGGFAALVGLRRNLFPGAPPYRASAA